MLNLYTVIMAGGSGTRFWPASRAQRPKQFLPLGTRSDEPLLAATVRRIAPLCPIERTIVVTGRHLAGATREILPELPAENLLAEPAARNTAPCIGWASAVIARRDPNAVVMVLPSDQFISDEPGFREVLVRALAMADSGTITTIGIRPNRPETGYGYIEVGEDLGGAHAVARFIEKPDRQRAEQYVASGRHLWNSGMFFFRARHMLEAIRTHLPELADGLSHIDAASGRGDPREERARLDQIFPTLPSISIDHGVMEKAARLAVVAGSFGWNDVGSWQSAWELAPKDAADNAGPEQAVFVGARGNLVRNLRKAPDGRVIALVGVDDLVVVDTDDALLVIPRDRAQDVRSVLEALRTRGDTDKL